MIAETSNLESISWYLNRLRLKALENAQPNSEEYNQAALAARGSLDILISMIKQESGSLQQAGETISEAAK